tara:strand:- start:59 stop:349 length:291 start_codon:yes stop_codon:yes gene_type:complete
LFFSSLCFLDSLSIGDMNHNQIKKEIIRVRSTNELGHPIAIIKLDIIKGIANTENKIDTKLKIAKDSLSKINLLLFFLICLEIIHSQVINLFMQFL